MTKKGKNKNKPNKESGAKAPPSVKPNPRPRPQKSKGKAKKKPAPVPIGLAMNAICGLTDPFCEHASVARIPDLSATPSFTYSVTSTFDVGLTAQGKGLWIFKADPSVPGIYATLDASGAVTGWTNAPTPSAWTSLGAEATSFRVVSWGVKYLTTQAWTGAQGVITSGTIAYEASTITSTSSVAFSNDVQLHALRDANIAFVGRRTDMESTHYIAYGQDPSDNWNTLVLMFNGGTPSSVCGSVVVTIHVEVRPQANSVSSRLARTALPNVPVAMTAVTAVHEAVPSVVNQALGSISSVIEEEAMKVAARFGPSLRDLVMAATA